MIINHPKICASVALLSLASMEAHAQSDGSSEGFFAPEEIIVTARKREESLQDTPISISVFKAEDIEALSAGDISALGNFTPNLNITFSQGNSGGSNLGATIRGVGQFDYLITTDPGVGTYLDGVYLGRTTGAVLDLLDVERIEVLRGPQGTLFGKNTAGGAISVVTKKPSDEFTGKAKLTLGEFDRIDAQLSLSGPLLEDKLLGQFAIASNNRDGYVDRLADGEELGDTDQLIARGALDWAVNSALSANLAIDYTRQRQSSAPSLLAEVNPDASILPLWNGFVGTPQAITPDDVNLTQSDIYETQQTGPNQNDLDITGLALTLTWDLAGIDIKSITAYRDMEAEFGRDGDNTPTEYVHTLNQVDQDQVSQEFQFIGSSFDEKLDWIAGLYYYREDAQDFNRPRLASGLFDALEGLPTSVDCLLAPPGAIPTCPAQTPGVPGGAGNPVNVALDLDLNVTTEQEVTSYALYGNFNVHLSDRTTANVGLRWTDEEKDWGIFSFREASGVIILPEGTSEKDSWQELSYRVGLDFNASDEVLFYGAYSRGFKSGGFNARPTSTGQVDSYDPEFIDSFELGFKAGLLDRHLRINAAYFYNEYDDIQLLVRTLDPVSGAFISLLQNAAEATIQGFEIETTALIGSRLSLGLGIGYIDDGYDDTGAAIGIDTSSDLLQTPQWNVNTSVQYVLNLDQLGDLVLRADYSYTSDYFQDAVNTESLRESGYRLLNLRASYLSPDQSYELAAFVTNALDEEYIVSGGEALDSFGTAEYTPGRPLEWGVSLVYNF